MTTQMENFQDVVNYLASKGCKFCVKETYNENNEVESVSISGASWYKEGKFYKVNNVIVAKNMLSLINQFIPLR